jgi:hypothetical protein
MVMNHLEEVGMIGSQCVMGVILTLA